MGGTLTDKPPRLPETAGAVCLLLVHNANLSHDCNTASVVCFTSCEQMTSESRVCAAALQTAAYGNMAPALSHLWSAALACRSYCSDPSRPSGDWGDRGQRLIHSF